MLRRMLRALARRSAGGELAALGELYRLRADLDAAIAQAARGAHDGPGRYSWAEVAAELGMTRQAAHKLYGGEAD